MYPKSFDIPGFVVLRRPDLDRVQPHKERERRHHHDESQARLASIPIPFAAHDEEHAPPQTEVRCARGPREAVDRGGRHRQDVDVFDLGR
jgi:hypothetical protein